MGDRIIDADAHITEPADLWTSRAPTKYRGIVPIVEREDGREVWTMEGRFIIGVGHTATAGWRTFPSDYPNTFDDLHPAAYDSKQRLAYMDANAIWAQVLYPNVAGFGAQNFLRASDEELKVRCVEIYNDFLHEWCSCSPERLIGIGALPFWDVGAAVKEAIRVAGMGMRGLLFTGEPQRFGLPRLGDSHWDPLFATAQELNLPLHFHVGAGEDGIDAIAGIAHAEVYLYLKNGIQCSDLLMCGVLERFPDLKFVSVESGTGWVPFVLEAADRGAARFIGPGCTMPSELFARQVFVTYWFEQVSPRYLLDALPTDNVLFETDFPHPACLYGDIQETIDRGLADAPSEVRQKFLWKNAARLYSIVGPPDSWVPDASPTW